jgi:hypothetical protein
MNPIMLMVIGDARKARQSDAASAIKKTIRRSCGREISGCGYSIRG